MKQQECLKKKTLNNAKDKMCDLNRIKRVRNGEMRAEVAWSLLDKFKLEMLKCQSENT